MRYLEYAREMSRFCWINSSNHPLKNLKLILLMMTVIKISRRLFFIPIEIEHILNWLSWLEEVSGYVMRERGGELAAVVDMRSPS